MFLRNHIECMFRDIHKVLTHDNKLKTGNILTYPINFIGKNSCETIRCSFAQKHYSRLLDLKKW